MCGRFGSSFTVPELEDEFSLSSKPKFKITKSYNVAPSQMILAVTKNSPTVARQMQWQFVPNWQKPSEAKFKPINARDDKLDGGFYKHAFNNNRCLIPASFFYEWQRVRLEGKEEKHPYLIKLKGKDLFGMAGIYEIHTDAEGKDHYFCAIITTSPNKLMKPIHDRMPVIVSKDDYDTWLEGEMSDVKKLVKPFDADLMEAYRVGSDVNNTRNNSEDLIKEIS